jgi:hypothetical protein
VFSDASFEGESVGEYGPYDFINTSAGTDPNGYPRAVLRVAYAVNEDEPSWADGTYEEGYHGGFIADEVAALMSLALGARMRAGEANRWFHPGSDPKGRPLTPPGETFAGLVIHPGRRLVLPSVATTKRIDGVQLLSSFVSLNPHQAIAVVRAARLYQDAVWICETQTELAWLMMVSAVETAANHWQGAEASAPERLRSWRPDLVNRLEASGGHQLVEYAAAEIAPVIGSTSKFCRFLETFAPSPPVQRPPAYAQVLWTSRALRRMFSRIYEYRSRALHTGTPFPAPMNWRPHAIGEATVFSEKIDGTAAGVGPFMWDEADTPLFLHTFEFIARQALTNWWKGMLSPNSPSP